jgi:hypothetical protein
MSVRKLLLGFVAILAVISLARAGTAADADKRPQPIAEKSGADTDNVGYQADNCRADDYCGEACGASGCCPDVCGVPCWQVYGDFLYLRPRNANLEYAVIMNGPISPGQVAVQEGRTASVDHQFEPGFRVGIARAFDECSMIEAAYTHYENRTSDSLTADQTPFVVRSLVGPNSLNAAADWLAASARQDIDFDIADAAYRRVFLCDERYSLSYVLGARYVSLKQRFSSQFESIINETVNSDVNFDGAGIRLGLEGERFSSCRRFFIYGKAAASILGGEFRANYLNGSPQDPVIAETNWAEARCVSILDCELGVGWQSCNGHVRAAAGYMFSGWFNVVKPSEFISSVQANQYHGSEKISGNGLEFDGLVAHIEFRR